jgi:hypothetical protein
LSLYTSATYYTTYANYQSLTSAYKIAYGDDAFGTEVSRISTGSPPSGASTEYYVNDGQLSPNLTSLGDLGRTHGNGTSDFDLGS